MNLVSKPQDKCRAPCCSYPGGGGGWLLHLQLSSQIEPSNDPFQLRLKNCNFYQDPIALKDIPCSISILLFYY